MNALPVTLATASILGLMFIWLSARVISARVAAESLIGDDGKAELIWPIRVHGNFTEYTPIFLLILAPLEHMGGNQIALVVLATLFVVARVLHVVGMGPEANLKPRQFGIIGSFTAIGAVALYGLFVAFF